MSLSSFAKTYLEFLELEAEPPGLAALSKLTRAHLLKVPFENVTTLLRYGRHAGGTLPEPEPEQLLRRAVEGKGGGLCYEVSRMFHPLLQELGYRVRLISGTVEFPSSHIALAVEWDNRLYLIDVGNGSPFFSPIPLGETVVVERFGLKYRFRPGPLPGQHLQERWIRGRWERFCAYDMKEISREDLYRSVCKHHTPGSGIFLGRLMMIRCTENEVYRLYNRELIRFTDRGKETTALQEGSDFADRVRSIFQLPRLPLEEGLEVLKRLEAW